jgi:5-methylcytosine-specific restriction protein A
VLSQCHAEGRVTAAQHVDHVVPREQGGSDDWANLQALCASCHSRKTALEDGGFGR